MLPCMMDSSEVSSRANCRPRQLGPVRDSPVSVRLRNSSAEVPESVILQKSGSSVLQKQNRSWDVVTSARANLTLLLLLFLVVVEEGSVWGL
jgi:hypothetical protein